MNTHSDHERVSAVPGRPASGQQPAAHQLPALLQLQRAIGNQAVNRLAASQGRAPAPRPAGGSGEAVVQRVIKNKTTDEVYAREDFEEDGKLSKAYSQLNTLTKAYAEFMIDYPGSTWSLQNENKSLKEFAEFNFGDEDPKATEAFLATIGQDDLIDLSRLKLRKDQEAFVHKRLEQLKQDLFKAWGDTPVLHAPQLPPGVTGSRDMERADAKGRADGEFYKTKNTLPGEHGKTTSAVNVTLGEQAMKAKNFEKVGEAHMSVCPGCSTAVDVGLLEVDHEVAFSRIRNTLITLAEGMSQNAKLRESIEKQLGEETFNLYFGLKKTEYYPTASAVKNYSNDVSNLIHICRLCNGAAGKSDDDFLNWFKHNPLYGQPFLDHFLDPSAISVLPRAKGGIGWGEAARSWLNDNHLPILTRLLELEQYVEPFRQSFRDQTLTSYEVKHADSDEKKDKLTLKERNLQHFNDTSLVHLRNLKRTRESTKVDEDDVMENYTPQSPIREDRLEQEKQEQRKREKRTELKGKNPHYDSGYEDARKGQAEKKLDQELPAKYYRMGHEDGLLQQEGDRIKGIHDGIGNMQDADLMAYAGYKKGFEIGTLRGTQVHDAGFKDGESHADVNLFAHIDMEEIGFKQLVRIYQDAYNEGKNTKKDEKMVLEDRK